MAEQTITAEQQEQQLRDIKRNSSNQIVSYTIDTDETPGLEYGYKKVPAVFTNYEESVFDRTIDQLSNELIVNLPEVPLEIIQQNFIDESKLYEVQGNKLVSIQGAEPEDEPKDEFSGRYELSSAAQSARDKRPDEISNGAAFQNSHFGGVSYYNNTVRDASDGYLTSAGHKEVRWDTKVFGPALQDFGYRVTKELIESGRNLNIRAVVSFCISHLSGNDVGAYASIRRQRPGDFTAPTYRFNTKGQTYTTPSYPMLQCVLDIPNSQLVENDLFQISSVFGSINDGVYIYGHKCVFEVTAQLPEEPSISWPPFGDTAASGGNVGIGNQDEAQETGTRAD